MLYLILPVIGFIVGYFVGGNNPPKSVIDKILKKRQGQ